MEGQVYLCSWKRIGDRYRVWWTKRPKVSAEADTFEDADELLWERIMEATGDGENSHEYDPPRPDEPSGGSGPDLVMVGGETYAWAETHEGIFEGGLCPECQQAIGQRTSKPLELRDLQSGPRNGGSITVLRSPFRGPTIHFVSGEFRSLLTSAEDAQFEWREIKPPPRSRKSYFELLGAKHVVPFVKPKAARPSGWWCERCGHTSSAFTGDADWKGPSWHVARSELPRRLPAVFAMGTAPNLHFACTRERWRAMMHEPGARGCRSYPVGVLDETLIHRSRPSATWQEINARAEARKAGQKAQEPVTLRSLLIALGEYDTGWHSPVKALAAAGRIIRAAKTAGAHVVVLPEMCITGLTMDRGRAESTTGERVKQLAKLVVKPRIHMIAGVALREEATKGETVVNAAVHFNVHGDVEAIYRQQRVPAPPGETPVLTPGREPVLDEIYWVRLAYFVGNDLRFPELFRAVAPDVDAMIVIANWPSEQREEWESLLRARAIESQSYVIGVNRMGKGGGVEYGGGSTAFDPAGEPAVAAGDGVRCVEVAQVRVRDVRRQ